MNTIPHPESCEQRESHKWWAVVDYEVFHVTGYSCAPNNPGYWWCPEVGYSLPEDGSLFDTEAEAMKWLINLVKRRIENSKTQLKTLEKRLNYIQGPA